MALPKRKKPTRFAIEYRMRDGRCWKLVGLHSTEAKATAAKPADTPMREFRVRPTRMKLRSKLSPTRRRNRARRAADLDRWKDVREAVLERDGHCCQRCGMSEGLQVHHVIGRRFKITFLDVENLLTLCPKCHWWIGNNGTAGGFWFAEKWPERAAYLAPFVRDVTSLESKVKVSALRGSSAVRRDDGGSAASA